MTGTRPVKVAAYLAVITIWISGIVALGTTHREPYPGLFQPGFAVAKGDQQKPLHVTYLAITTQGNHPIDPLKILHPAGGKEGVLAVVLLDTANESDPGLRSWLAGRVNRLVDGDADELRVTWFQGTKIMIQKTFDLR